MGSAWINPMGAPPPLPPFVLPSTQPPLNMLDIMRSAYLNNNTTSSPATTTTLLARGFCDNAVAPTVASAASMHTNDTHA